MKTTDDEKVVKYKTSNASDLQKMEKVNNIVLAAMGNVFIVAVTVIYNNNNTTDMCVCVCMCVNLSIQSHQAAEI